MLKLYRAYPEGGKIKIEDKIDFKYGQFDTGLDGFGEVKSSNLGISKANYELQELRSFKEYVQTVETVDGYVKDFVLWYPMTYEMLKDQYKDIPKKIDTYEQYGLNEEAILLFTDYVRLHYSNNDLVQRIFGRYPDNGMYLIMPNASFSLVIGAYGNHIIEDYEVLQSQNLGKRIILSKMNRKI